MFISLSHRMLLVCMILLLSSVVMNSRDIQAQGAPCAITLGGGGNSETYSVDLSFNNPTAYLHSVKPREFIRSTSGPCVFVIYNGENFHGKSVILGTDLSDRIRSGLDGIENRNSGGGDTWRVRSIFIGLVPDYTCALRIGGNGVRMTYFSTDFDYPEVPAMNRVSLFEGPENCRVMLFNSTDFQGNSRTISPFPDNGNAYDPGFRVRSLQINHYYQ